MRGSDESARTLVLIDGVPKNKMSGGFVNWSMINSDEVERIEITKGPVSALYGNNAMSGVINIITKEPEKDFEGKFKDLLWKLSNNRWNALPWREKSTGN
jgi:outer membrane receptor for ferrienterochelin and colicin